MGQVMLRRFDWLIVEPMCTAGMVVDIHKTGTNVQSLGIDDLAAVGNGGRTHLAVTRDQAVFHKQDRFGDQMVTHDQGSIFYC